ncbi:hypothetical protein BGZ83_007554 [Gryganskiella cystojenkinii]|nr:hypothetical protein BGZ83_007554 [Gryganskiella cystojenkinii]
MSNPQQWLDLYDRIWSRLEDLDLEGSWHDPDYYGHGEAVLPFEPTASQLSERVGPAQIKYLRFHGSETEHQIVQAQLWVIKQCRDLVRLDWGHSWHGRTGRPEKSCLHWMAKEIRTGGHGWQKLESLSLWSRDIYEAEDFGVMAESMPRLKELYLSTDLGFSIEHWKALAPMYSRLVRLHIWSIHDVGGAVVQDILCTLENLEDFSAKQIMDNDILDDGRPWVCCDRLQKLRLKFNIILYSSSPSPSPSSPLPTSPSSPLLSSWSFTEAHTVILSRIGKLIQLEDLDVSGAWPETGSHELDLSLGPGGLELLKGLCRLKKLTGPEDQNCGRGIVYEARTKWGMAEVEWVEVHWPKIQEVDNMDMTQEAQARLQRILAANQAKGFSSSKQSC